MFTKFWRRFHHWCSFQQILWRAFCVFFLFSSHKQAFTRLVVEKGSSFDSFITASSLCSSTSFYLFLISLVRHFNFHEYQRTFPHKNYVKLEVKSSFRDIFRLNMNFSSSLWQTFGEMVNVVWRRIYDNYDTFWG